MPKVNDIRELAQKNALYVSNSPRDWMGYLDVAARLYRYSFSDTLLIHAQRPDATACAEMKLWNGKMNRWVNRGAKGIALIDDTGPRIGLRYVFDISDTHIVNGGRTPLLWNLDSHEHEQAILDHLADTYGLSQTDSMNAALMELAQQLTADNLDEAMDGLAYEVADTFLEELDGDNIRVRFRELMANSIFYTLSRRCGQEPMDVLDDDDFIRIVDFNKLPVLSFLGNAVSEQCEAVLFDIGREMRKIYQKEFTLQLEKSVHSLYNTNTDFSALKHETKETTTKGGQENGVDVSSQGRLPVPESGREGRAADHREVRDAAQDVPEREPQELVSEYADEQQTESALGADRGSSGEPDGSPVGQPEREVSGSEQGERPADMGSAPEQPDGDGRGDRAEGIGVQLTETTTEQDLSEAEEEIASAFSFPDLPTVEQQIRAIEAPIQARYADEIALDPEVVDEILRTGSNRSKGQLRLIYNFMVEKTPEEYTEFVKNEYGTGGKGFEIDDAKYAAWFDDLGLRIAAGNTAKGGTIANAFLSWEDVSSRIHELLRQGEYAPQAVLDAARQNALQEHAQALAYMERDLADGVAEAVFQDAEIFRGGFPALTDRLAGLLDDTAFLSDLNERLSALGEAYAEDKDLMRMHFYKPDKVAALFQQFAKPYQNYAARDGFHWNEYKKFITEDEINAYFTRGSNYSDSRLAIYSFFLNHEDKKERADFLKDHYGIGGCSHALSGADDSHENHDGRGISLEHGTYGNPDARVHLNWNQAAGRIDQLIRDSEYLKPADYSRMSVYEREWMAMRVMGFYHHLPNEVERPYLQDLYHEEGRKALVEKLADSEQAAELLEQMDNALLSVPMDSEEYESKAESLSILHQYVEGTYTIFPEKKQAVEIAAPEHRQMSMLDFMEQEPQSKEQSTAAAVEEPQKAKVVARYQSTVMIQDGYIEDIAILQFPDGKFYNHYNYDEEKGEGAAETGPFNSLNDAKAVISQAREDAKAVESFENQPKQLYSRENGSFLYLDNNHLYRIERSNAHDVYLKDMENSAVAGRVIPLPSYSETLAKNPLNDFLKLNADQTQKDSRSIYKECLYTLLEKVERSEIYPLLRDRDTTEEEAENLIREKIEDLFASGEVENAVYSEAIDTWAHFGEWIQEDIFQRTYQDVITDSRDAVALYQDSMDAPQWVRGIMVPYEELQEIEIFDKPGLFSNGRLRDEEVPEGLYRYDLRGSDYDPGQPVTVEKNVVVNHAASVLMAEELDLGAKGRLELGEEGLNFTGAELTVREFMEEQQQKRSGLIHGDSDRITVEGHIGTWYAVDETEIGGEKFFLLEHEEHGDMAACVAVNEQGKLVAEDLWNGFDDGFLDAVKEYLSEKWNMPNKDDVVSEIIEKAVPVPDNSAQDYSDVPVYYEPFSYAQEHGEVDLYRTSYRMNSECKQAIHEAIADNYDGMHLGDDAVNQVVQQYGMERVGYILANTLHHKSYDGRFSASNKEWAEQVSTPEHNAERMTFRTDWVVDSHPAVLNGFVTMYRDELEAQKKLEQEQPFVKHFYVVENLQAAPLKIERFGNLDDAMSQYQALPSHYMKALGVEKNPDPLPGSLDILQCKNGIDTIVEDYKTVPGWDNPYIQNHVVQPLQGALAVQDVEVAYELPDAYFYIQTCDDGFDYTLYNKDFTERDGGVLETDGDKPIQEAVTELLTEFGYNAAEGGRVMDAAELREQADTVAEQQAEVLKEKLAAEKPAPKETLSFYAAECLEFTFAGEFHDHLTMEEALEAYDKIPANRMNADKCIGFCIEEDGGFVGMYELVVNDKVQRENINSINYFRDDKLVQQAISDTEELMAVRQKNKEQERGSTKKSVLEALRGLKAKKQEQPEQDKPKKAKKKGMEL